MAVQNLWKRVKYFRFGALRLGLAPKFPHYIIELLQISKLDSQCFWAWIELIKTHHNSLILQQANIWPVVEFRSIYNINPIHETKAIDEIKSQILYTLRFLYRWVMIICWWVIILLCSLGSVISRWTLAQNIRRIWSFAWWSLSHIAVVVGTTAEAARTKYRREWVVFLNCST